MYSFVQFVACVNDRAHDSKRAIYELNEEKKIFVGQLHHLTPPQVCSCYVVLYCVVLRCCHPVSGPGIPWYFTLLRCAYLCARLPCIFIPSRITFLLFCGNRRKISVCTIFYFICVGPRTHFMEIGDRSREMNAAAHIQYENDERMIDCAKVLTNFEYISVGVVRRSSSSSSSSSLFCHHQFSHIQCRMWLELMADTWQWYAICITIVCVNLKNAFKKKMCEH